jgi:hypothetical protein
MRENKIMLTTKITLKNKMLKRILPVSSFKNPKIKVPNIMADFSNISYKLK